MNIEIGFNDVLVLSHERMRLNVQKRLDDYKLVNDDAAKSTKLEQMEDSQCPPKLSDFHSKLSM